MVRIVIECTPEYKKNVAKMAKEREMSTTAFFKFLVEKQKEDDRRNK